MKVKESHLYESFERAKKDEEEYQLFLEEAARASAVLGSSAGPNRIGFDNDTGGRIVWGGPVCCGFGF